MKHLTKRWFCPTKIMWLNAKACSKLVRFSLFGGSPIELVEAWKWKLKKGRLRIQGHWNWNIACFKTFCTRKAIGPNKTSWVPGLISSDVNETFSLETETRPRPFKTKTETFFEMSQTVQPVMLCFVHLLRKTSATVLQKLSRHFPKDCMSAIDFKKNSSSV